MAGSPSPIQELRTRLEKSRWLLHEGVSQLQQHFAAPPSEASVPIPVPPKRELAARMLLGMAAGMAVLEMARRFWHRGR